MIVSYVAGHRDATHAFPKLLLILTSVRERARLVSAQDPPPRIGRFVIDGRGIVPVFTRIRSWPRAAGCSSTSCPAPASVWTPARMSTCSRGKSSPFGLGASGHRSARSHATPSDATSLRPVTERFTSLTPQLSLNFGNGDGWSYLSGGIGAATWSMVPDGRAEPPPADQTATANRELRRRRALVHQAAPRVHARRPLSSDRSRHPAARPARQPAHDVHDHRRRSVGEAVVGQSAAHARRARDQSVALNSDPRVSGPSQKRISTDDARGGDAQRHGVHQRHAAIEQGTDERRRERGQAGSRLIGEAGAGGPRRRWETARSDTRRYAKVAGAEKAHRETCRRRGSGVLFVKRYRGIDAMPMTVARRARPAASEPGFRQTSDRDAAENAADVERQQKRQELTADLAEPPRVERPDRVVEKQQRRHQQN